MIPDELNQCMQRLCDLYPTPPPFYVPQRAGTPEHICFTVNHLAHGTVMFSNRGFRVWVGAYYGDSDSETDVPLDDISKAVDSLYKHLLGPTGNVKGYLRLGDGSEVTEEDVGAFGRIGRQIRSKVREEGEDGR